MITISTMTAKQLVAAQRGINKRFILLRDRGAIVNAVYALLKSVEAELALRRIRW